MLDKKVVLINNGFTSSIVHRKAKPMPPKGNPETINPNNIIIPIFHTFDFDKTADPLTQTKIKID